MRSLDATALAALASTKFRPRTFSKKKSKLRVTVSRGGRLVALGHANVVHCRATLTMSELRTRSHGAWHITVVFSQTVQAAASTQTLPVRVR